MCDSFGLMYCIFAFILVIFSIFMVREIQSIVFCISKTCFQNAFGPIILFALFDAGLFMLLDSIKNSCRVHCTSLLDFIGQWGRMVMSSSSLVFLADFTLCGLEFVYLDILIIGLFSSLPIGKFLG